MWNGDVKVSTVGELRKALEGLPDDAPLVKTQRRRGVPSSRRTGVRPVEMLINLITLASNGTNAVCMRSQPVGDDDRIVLRC